MDVRLPPGLELAPLARHHRRKEFCSEQAAVDDWLRTKAHQHQEKRLSVTKALIDSGGKIAGYYTIAPSQIDHADLPRELVKKLPKRALPVAVIAWLGVSQSLQGRGLGARLLALALRDCHKAGKTFPFVAVLIDCLDDRAKQFFRQFDLRELPGNPYRLFVSAAQLEALAGQ